MERRKFVTLPLAAMAAPGALLAADAGSAPAAVAPAAVPTATLPAGALKGLGHGGKDALPLQQIKKPRPCLVLHTPGRPGTTSPRTRPLSR